MSSAYRWYPWLWTEQVSWETTKNEFDGIWPGGLRFGLTGNDVWGSWPPTPVQHINIVKISNKYQNQTSTVIFCQLLCYYYKKSVQLHCSILNYFSIFIAKIRCYSVYYIMLYHHPWVSAGKWTNQYFLKLILVIHSDYSWMKTTKQHQCLNKYQTILHHYY